MRARDNPFATDRVLRVRYQPQGWTWDELLARLRDLQFRAAIVGPKGSGKTTLLEDLAAVLSDRGFAIRHFQLTSEIRSFGAPEWRRIASRLEQRDVVLLDGCEQLSWLGWHRFQRATSGAAGLVVTTHLPGRLPTLLRTTTSPDLLAQIIHDLTGRVPADLDEVYSHHRGNIREAIRELYDRVAVLPCAPSKVPLPRRYVRREGSTAGITSFVP